MLEKNGLMEGRWNLKNINGCSIIHLLKTFKLLLEILFKQNYLSMEKCL